MTILQSFATNSSGIVTTSLKKAATWPRNGATPEAGSTTRSYDGAKSTKLVTTHLEVVTTSLDSVTSPVFFVTTLMR